MGTKSTKGGGSSAANQRRVRFCGREMLGSTASGGALNPASVITACMRSLAASFFSDCLLIHIPVLLFPAAPKPQHRFLVHHGRRSPHRCRSGLHHLLQPKRTHALRSRSVRELSSASHAGKPPVSTRLPTPTLYDSVHLFRCPAVEGLG